MILLRDVTKVYPNGICALQDVNLEIASGEFVFLVGSSGAGKSTLIRLLIREELPSAGYIFVAGHNVTKIPPRLLPLFRRKVGVIFQDFRLLPNKTVAENVALALQVVNHPPREIRRMVQEALELVGVSQYAHHFPPTLSGGEQQRVAVARAIVRDPDVLIADEPTGNLDPATAEELMVTLTRINELGTTVVVATHNQEMVDMLRRRVIVMARGQVVRDEREGTYHGKRR